MLKWVGKFIGGNETDVKKYDKIVRAVAEQEPSIKQLSDEQLRAKTDEFKERLAAGESLDKALPEAFAVVREASVRTTGMRHFDVQIIGGAVIHQGKIAEMKTGEGKTLVATLPLYLNALEGHGAHLITVNDYLAKYHAQLMGPIYHFLGLTVGVIQHESAFVYDPQYPSTELRLRHLRPVSRREAYEADITYGTNNEFGFDYLRDNMVWDLNQRVQRELNFAIVDEVDNILIDEARTPLIISGSADEATDGYKRFASIVPQLRRDLDFTVDEKLRTISLTEEGIDRVEHMLGVQNLYDPDNYALTSYLEQALKAQFLFKRNVDYVLFKDGQVIESGNPFESEIVIVDEFTGRLMHGRRYSEGLHQAIEAKERVKVQRENVTMATITFQNYFRMYNKLAGMTGTALTESEEFHQIYRLDVVPIPTNRPMVRQDFVDQVYKNTAAKYRSVLAEIEEMHEIGRPVLVGTTSIEKSEMLHQMLQRKGIPHQVLNAKYHEQEAAIIAQAGRSGSVTIATNMAGRGVDILLGGNADGLAEAELRKQGVDPETGDPEIIGQAHAEAKRITDEDRKKVVELGGLHVVGTERHESRRIDNQLRGRAGRQGDPGSSRFYVSLDDELMRRFGGTSVASLMDRLKVDEDLPIENSLVMRVIENAQTKVEGHHFDMRKHVVQYDDVMNKQREVIYNERVKILQGQGEDLKEHIQDLLIKEVQELVQAATAGEIHEEWDLEGIIVGMRQIMALPEDFAAESLEGLSREEIEETLLGLIEHEYEQREQAYGPELMRQIERAVMLSVIDRNWVQHLTAMDDLREGIGLEAYGQKDPLVEYKRRGFDLFQDLLNEIQNGITHMILRVSIQQEAPAPKHEMPEGQTNRSDESYGTARANENARLSRSNGKRSYTTNGAATEAKPEPIRAGPKVGRNDPCPCGSGKKYKHCHGK